MVAAKTLILLKGLDNGQLTKDFFEVRESEIDTSFLKDGDLMLQILCMSADPYLRGSFKVAGANQAGNAIRGFVSGKVTASKNADWVVGDLFGANLPFSTVQIVTKDVAVTLRKLTGYLTESTISQGVGIMGMPGSTGTYL